MPSDNLGPGVFDTARAKAINGRSGKHATAAAGQASCDADHLRRKIWVLVVAELAVGDVAAVVVAAGVATLLGVLPADMLLATLLGVPPLVVLGFLERGLYGRPRLVARRFPAASIALGWATAFGAFLLAWLAIGPAGLAWLDGPSMPFGSAATCLAALPLGAAILMTWRLAWRRIGPAVARPADRRVIVVGGARAAARLVDRLRANAGVEVVGIMAGEGAAGAAAGRGLLARGRWTLDELSDLVRDGRVDTALVADSGSEDARTLEAVLEQARQSALDVHVLPDFGVAGRRAGRPAALAWLGDIPVVPLQRRPLDAAALAIKRAEDLVLGSLMLAVMLPVLGPVAAIVRLGSPGPVLVRQLRLGLNGRPFSLLSFRTVRPNGRRWGFGSLLRHHRLDELPHLFNVLRGDMSLVGPRPVAPLPAAAGMVPGLMTERGRDEHPARLRMKPGLTGWSQIIRRGQPDTAGGRVRRIEQDLFYIETWSLWLDVLVLLKTVSCLLSPGTRR